MIFKYQAIRTKQTETGSYLILFSAPATQINEWAGVPQKTIWGDGNETVGFQRSENPKRRDDLVSFFSDDNNIIQNPLLCATRDFGASVAFTPTSSEESKVQHGTLTIEMESEERDLLTALKELRAQLESRVPELREAQIPPELMLKLKQESDEFSEVESTEEDEHQGDSLPEFTDESHIFDFWRQVAARVKVLEELNDYEASVFQGFSLDSVESFLKPLVLVDGQHRLSGAIQATEAKLGEDELIQESVNRISAGEDPDDIYADQANRVARHLPVSLLMTDDPAEHVFQFVVVNQKAQAIDKALLGTIVSTSLSNEELKGVSERLINSGIQLDDYQAATYVVRNPESPFRDLVDRGFGNSGDLLKWGVLLALVNSFRHLSGAKLYHQSKRGHDFAAVWRQNWLSESAIVDGFEELGFDSAYGYWSSRNGPWRDCFMRFWSRVRDLAANTTSPDARNYWGKPSHSNLFNKVSLNILLADFFCYMFTKDKTISSVEAIDGLVDGWLGGTKPQDYFGRDWDLANTKKDSPGTRKQWSDLWHSYRTVPNQKLPKYTEFRKPYNEQ